MKSFLRAAAATGVAAATLAAGLSIAPAAQAEPLELGKSVTIPSLWKTPSGYFAAEPGAQLPYFVDQYTDYSSIPMPAGAFTFTEVKGQDWGILHVGSSCMFANGDTTDASTYPGAACADFALYYEGAKWTLEGGVPVNVRGDAWSAKKRYPGGGLRFTSDRSEWVKPGYFHAEVADIDLEAGTAKLVDGVAPEGADSVEVSWKTADGATKSRNVTLKEDGTWSRDLDGLALGKTTVHLEAFAGDESLAESDVEVDLAVSDLTANAEFSDDVDEVAHITGTASPHSSIVAFHGERQIQTTMADAEGKYSLAINPPNVGGPYDVRVDQRIRGQAVNSAEVQLDYGTAVSITGPEDGETLDPGDDLVVRGAAQPGAELKIYEQGKADAPLKELTVGTNGTYRAVIDGDTLEDREYKLVVQGVSKGHNITSAEVTVNPGKSTVKQPTAQVDFDADVTKRAVVSGEGAAGATITVKNGSDTLGSTSVADDGTWSLAIEPIGPGQHTLTVEQTGVDGTQTTTAVADYGDAVAITSQADGKVAPGVTEISGTTQAGAQVQVTVGGKIIDATVEGTTWTAQAEIAPSPSPLTITATQRSKGALTTTDTKQVTTDAQQEAKDVTITDPADHTFTPQQTTTVRGTATPFAKIEVRFQWNDSVQATTTANAKGEWSFDRKYGMATYELTATQTRLDGTTTTSAPFALSPAGASEVAPTAKVVFGSSLNEKAVVTGAGQANAVITVKDENGKELGRTRIPGSSGEGTWSIPIDPIGAGKHTLTIEQTGSLGTQMTTAVADYGDAVAITSQADGKVAPGVTEISGTTQAGAQVQVTVGGKIIDATVEGTTWTAQAEIAPSPSPLTITATQRSKGALTTTDTKQVTTDAQQEAKDVTITDPADHTFTPQQTTTVRGTATPFAKIEVRFQWNDSVQATTTANAKGEWSFDRKYGMATYELTATQTRLDGTTTTSAPFVMGPDGSFLPLTLLTPSPISSFIPGSPVHFSGTATKNATSTATAPEWNNNVVFTAKADENGNWKYDRQFAKGVTYRLVLTQVDGGGTTDQITGIVLTDATS